MKLETESRRVGKSAKVKREKMNQGKEVSTFMQEDKPYVHNSINKTLKTSKKQ